MLALDSHVRYTVTGRLRWAGASGARCSAGMCFWEKTAIIGLILPILSLGYLTLRTDARPAGRTGRGTGAAGC